jgi:peptidoglycan-N-acetylglucosamine deacetylase
MRIVRIILLTAIICIAIFSEKETGIFTFTQPAFSSEQAWSQTVSPSPAFKAVPAILLPAFQSQADTSIELAGIASQMRTQREISPAAKVVALTFDDGPHPQITKQILDTLDRYNAKATFFMVGEHVRYFPQTVQDVFKRGHEIGNHTWNHSDLTELKEEEIEKEISSTNEAIQQIIGKKPAVFRPPYGSLTDSIRKQIDMTIALWSADTFDWKYKDEDLILEELSNKVHNRAIVLMHDIYPSTADSLEEILKYLKEEGYTFVTVSELFALEQK